MEFTPISQQSTAELTALLEAATTDIKCITADFVNIDALSSALNDLFSGGNWDDLLDSFLTLADQDRGMARELLASALPLCAAVRGVQNIKQELTQRAKLN